MIPLNNIIAKARKSHFLRYGLPFFVLVVGGSFLTVDFQRVKYEEKERRRGTKLLEMYGIDKEIDLNEELRRVQKANENHEWQNVRGPRPYEDNTEFLRNREIQEKRLQQYLERQKELVKTDVNPST